MKNKIVFVIGLALVLFAGFIAQGGALAQAVPVPVEINDFITMLVFGAVTAGFVFLFNALGIDLRGLATPIAGTLSGYLVLQLQGIINTIPETYDFYVSIVFKIIVIIIGGIGTLYVIAKSNKRDTLLG